MQCYCRVNALRDQAMRHLAPGGEVLLACGVTKDLTKTHKAGDIVKKTAAICGMAAMITRVLAAIVRVMDPMNMTVAMQ